MPSLPVMAVSPVADLEALRSMELLMAMPVAPFFDLNLDTLPAPRFRYDAKIWYNGKEWEELSQEFEKKFREHFGEFYQKNNREFENMMKEIGENFKKHYDLHLTFPQEEWMKKQEEAMKHQEEALSRFHQSESWKKFEESMHEWKALEAVQFKEMEENMRRMEETMRGMERKEGEKIRDMSWTDDGEIEVNGIKIKQADKPKYMEIQRKYMKDRGSFRYSE
jgi:hypothetical protein